MYTWEICGHYSDESELICYLVKPFLSARDFKSFKKMAELPEEIIAEEFVSEGLYEYDDRKFPDNYELYGEDVMKAIEEQMESFRASKIAESEFSIEKIGKEISNQDRFISAFKHAIKLHRRSEIQMDKTIGDSKGNIGKK